MSSQPFPYSPLEEPDSFRILHLQPSPDRAAEIQCKLEHTNLTKYDYEIIDPYTALSYVWGDASNPRIVQVDGQPVAVTKNLHDALECLRDDKKVLSIWADAICINQLDIPERSSQVKQMGRIYSSATHTVIFLDSSSRDLDFVLRELRPLTGHEPDIFIEQFELVWSHFSHILTRPWFQRVWVLQELVLSRDPFVQCGRSRLRWDSFCNLAITIEEFEKRFVPLRPASKLVGGNAPPGSHIAKLRQQRDYGLWKDKSEAGFPSLTRMSLTRSSYHWDIRGRTKENDNKLQDLVVSRRGYGASDPRDIVFAQMGLVSEKGENSPEAMKIDYSKSTARVYAEMTYYIIREGVDTFRMIEDRTSTQHHLGISSWVPDWSKLWTPNRRFHDSQRSIDISRNHSRPARLHYPYLRLERLQNNKHALLIDVILAGEIVQLGGAVRLATDLAGKKSFAEYFVPEISANKIEAALLAWTWPETLSGGFCGDKSDLVDTGFRRILYSWAYALGLHEDNMLPYDDIIHITERVQQHILFEEWPSRIFAGCPFGLLSMHYGFAASSESSPTWDEPPFISTDRLCTIKCQHVNVIEESCYQIIVVPGTSQLGDVVADVEVKGSRNLILIRPVQLPRLDLEALPSTYEVIGTCYSNVDIKGLFEVNEFRSTIALV